MSERDKTFADGSRVLIVDEHELRGTPNCPECDSWRRRWEQVHERVEAAERMVEAARPLSIKASRGEHGEIVVNEQAYRAFCAALARYDGRGQG